jgi:hypothetical protein
MKILETQKITLGAFGTVDGNGTPLDMNVFKWPGTRIVAKEADYPFQIRFDDGGWNDFDLAMSADCDPGDTFTNVYIRNLGPGTSELVFLVGNMRVGDGRLAISENRNGAAASYTPPALNEVVSTVGVDGVVTGAWVKLLPYDANREKVWLWTDATTAAYWGHSATSTQNPARNLVRVAGEPRWLEITTKAEIWVYHTEAAKSVTAQVFSY